MAEPLDPLAIAAEEVALVLLALEVDWAHATAASTDTVTANDARILDGRVRIKLATVVRNVNWRSR